MCASRGSIYVLLCGERTEMNEIISHHHQNNITHIEHTRTSFARLLALRFYV